jgi:hypothetical protein
VQRDEVEQDFKNTWIQGGGETLGEVVRDVFSTVCSDSIKVLQVWHLNPDETDAVIKSFAIGGVYGTRTLVVSQVLQSRSKYNLPVGFENFGGQCRSNVSCRTKIASKNYLIIKECGDIIPEHNPVIPREFAYVANVSSAASHNGLWHFAISHINVIARVRADQSFKLDTMVP